MNYVVVSAKIDPQTKSQAMAMANELGMPLSVIIKAFLKQFIRTRSVSFSAAGEEPNNYLKSVIKQAEKNYLKGRSSPRFNKAKDAIKFLEEHGI